MSWIEQIRKGATTTTTRGNKNSMKKNTTTNKDNNTTKVTALFAGGRKVRGRKNSVASVGADLAPTRLHFGGVSPPMSTSHKGSSRRSGILVPMSMVLKHRTKTKMLWRRTTCLRQLKSRKGSIEFVVQTARSSREWC